MERPRGLHRLQDGNDVLRRRADRIQCADDVADVIAWALPRPLHVNIDLVRVMPRNQSDARTLVRDSDADGALPVSSLETGRAADDE